MSLLRTHPLNQNFLHLNQMTPNQSKSHMLKLVFLLLVLVFDEWNTVESASLVVTVLVFDNILDVIMLFFMNFTCVLCFLFFQSDKMWLQAAGQSSQKETTKCLHDILQGAKTQTTCHKHEKSCSHQQTSGWDGECL